MIHRNLLVYLQRLQLAAAHEYFYFVCGAVDEQKFQKLREKFQFFYSTSESKSARSRRRARGEAATILHAIRHDQKVHFCLMSTRGKGRVHEREMLSDLRQKSARLLSPCKRFELIHDGKSWSWSMSKAEYRKWRERIHTIAALRPERRKIITNASGELRDSHIERLLDRLYSQPGFRLIRKQIGELIVFLHREWTRLRLSSDLT